MHEKPWLRLIGIPIIAIVFPLVFHAPDDPRLPYAILTTVLGVWLIWEANRLFIFRLRGWLSWNAHPMAHVFAQVVGSVLMVTAFVTTFNVLAFRYFYKTPLDMGMLKKILFLAIMVTLMMNAIYESIYFSMKWKASFTKAQALRRDNLQSHFNNLKNQVSPHFLFNSLNTLTTLIEENTPLAKKFTDELSHVFRYVFESRERKLVKVKEELEFSHKYIFLQNMRFAHALSLEIRLSKAMLETYIPPITLQMLLENAVKHNIVSAAKPLTIVIGEKEGRLFVRNNLQKKGTLSNSTGIGLQNINNRYHYFHAGKILIEQTPEYFQVSLPVILKDEA